jgi:hypothetical protein
MGHEVSMKVTIALLFGITFVWAYCPDILGEILGYGAFFALVAFVAEAIPHSGE